MTAAEIANGVASIIGGPSMQQVGVSFASCIADLVMLEPHLHMVEIKARTDSTVRLQRQVEIFGSVFPRCSVACDSRHERKVLEIIPLHWGLFVVVEQEIVLVRDAQPHPALDPELVAQQLFKEDLWRLCIAHELRPRSAWSKRALANRVATALPLEIILEAWLVRLRWRIDNPGQSVTWGGA